MTKRAHPLAPARSFEAVLQSGSRALGWTIARLPFVPATVWPQMLRQRVRGTVNGFPFRTSLFHDEAGSYLLVNAAMQRGAKSAPGSLASFTLEPDMEPRPAELPEPLDALLDESEGLRGFYDSLSEYTRREIGKWVAGVKSAAARVHRSEQVAERLLATMEAEVELPPLIARAFAQRPRAAAGWLKMTAVQRRGELMAVFYYQSPEAREKRLGKLCDLAECRA